MAINDLKLLLFCISVLPNNSECNPFYYNMITLQIEVSSFKFKGTNQNMEEKKDCLVIYWNVAGTAIPHCRNHCTDTMLWFVWCGTLVYVLRCIITPFEILLYFQSLPIECDAKLEICDSRHHIIMVEIFMVGSITFFMLFNLYPLSMFKHVQLFFIDILCQLLVITTFYGKLIHSSGLKHLYGMP